MEVYVAFLKTVFQTVITLVSAAATLFSSSPSPPVPQPSAAQEIGLRRIALVWHVDVGVSLARLASADPADRTRAACELQKAGRSAADAIPALASMLHDDTPVDATVCGERWGRRFRDDAVTSPGERAAAALAAIGSASFDIGHKT